MAEENKRKYAGYVYYSNFDNFSSFSDIKKELKVSAAIKDNSWMEEFAMMEDLDKNEVALLEDFLLSNKIKKLMEASAKAGFEIGSRVATEKFARETATP